MDFESNFKEMCSQLEVECSYSKSIIDSFNSSTFSKSDKKRIEFVHKIGEKFKIPFLRQKPSIIHHLASSIKPLKSANLSTSHRLKGNDFYKEKKYCNAISCYNRSILEGEGESLALAYANRSMAYYCQATTDWFHILRDIQLALDHGYPKHLEHKLRERQGDCWVLLRNVKQALICYTLGRDLLVGKVKDDKPVSVLGNIMTKLKGLHSGTAFTLGKVVALVDVSEVISDVETFEQDIIKKRISPPDLYEERNPLMPCASKYIQLSNSPGRGRCLIATEDHKAGETIIVEKAFVSTLKKDFKETHCHFCFHWTPGPVPCLRCSQVGFCSISCRDKAWTSYHQFECGLTDVILSAEVNETVRLALRTVLMVDRETLLNAPKKLPADFVYDSTNYGTIHHLDGNTARRPASDLFRLSVLAYYLICLVRGQVDLELSAALLRLIQSYSCNVHSIDQKIHGFSASPKQLIECATTIIGDAITPVLGLINHSCNPNIIRTCYGDVAVVTVTRPIKRGEEIVLSYGPHYLFHLKAFRQSELKKLHFFRCCCPACMEDWSQINDISSLNVRNMITFSELQFSCPDGLDKLEIWARKFIGYLNSMDAGQPNRQPVREYSETQAALKYCYDLMATLSPQVLQQMRPAGSPSFGLMSSLNHLTF